MARLTPPSAAAHAVHDSARLPGGQCGSAYDGVIELPAALRVVRVEVDAAVGLQPLAAHPARLLGTPQQAGSSTVTVHCVDARGAAHVLHAQLHVSASAQSLWTSRPSDQTDPMAKSDQHSVLLDAAGARALGASVRGRAHAQRGGFREDDFRVASLPGGHIALIVSDGAGSAELAREGSRIAVSAALEALQLRFAQRTPHPSVAGAAAACGAARSGHGGADQPAATMPITLADADYIADLRGAAEHACAELDARAHALQRPVADLHATLLIALARPGTPLTVAALQVGDGLIAVQGGGSDDSTIADATTNDATTTAAAAPGHTHDPHDTHDTQDAYADWSGPLCASDHGEFEGQTQFLTRAAFDRGDFDARIRVRHFARGGRLMVCSDGIVDPFFDTEQSLITPECWQPFVASLDAAVGAADGDGDAHAGGAVDAQPDADVQAALLAWLQTFTPGHHDDRTLLLLDRMPAPDATRAGAR